MDYIISVTLKHREKTNKFKDYWIRYNNGEHGDNKKLSMDAYKKILREDGDNKWFVWTICLSSIIKSTD